MSRDLVIRGATLHDGLGGTVEDAVVLVADGRIAYAGPRAGAPTALDAVRSLDADGRWLIPGLIDCHVHLCFDGTADFQQEAGAMTSARAALKAAANARRQIEAGITTVRDLGGIGTATIEAAWAQREGIASGARVLTAGEVITITGGHAYFIGREADTAEEIVRAVRTLRKLGADCVKIVATGGVLTKSVPAQRSAYTVEQMAAAVAEARESDMRVAAHAIGASGIEAALRAGVDSIEHGCFLTDDAIKLMRENPSWLVATLSAPHQICFGGEGVPEFAVDKSREVMVSHGASFARAAEAGVRIAAGTDAGTPFNPHGNLPLELRLMHDNGLPLDRVLSAATSEAAALLGREDLGALEPGRIADALLLDADPLADVGAYTRVAAVVQDGAIVLDRR